MANGGPPSNIASWVSKYHCHGGLWSSWTKKFQKSKARQSCPHWTSPPGSGQSLSLDNPDDQHMLAFNFGNRQYACALLSAWPTQTQENNYIWTLDSLISTSAQAYTSSTTKTSEWSLMPPKHCFPQIASIQTAKKLCFALCGPSSVSLITSVHRKSSPRLVTILNSQSIRDSVVTNARIATWLMLPVWSLPLCLFKRGVISIITSKVWSTTRICPRSSAIFNIHVAPW